MKIKTTILMLLVTVAILGCKPQADSGSGGSTPSTPTETPAAPATPPAPGTNTPAPQP